MVWYISAIAIILHKTFENIVGHEYLNISQVGNMENIWRALIFIGIPGQILVLNLLEILKGLQLCILLYSETTITVILIHADLSNMCKQLENNGIIC